MNLIYIADPMCSWCYGFGKTLDALLADPRDAHPLNLAIILGGLRPYTSEALTKERADEIAGHWHHVHEATGLPFAETPHSAMHSDGFIYDTEPASRAVATVRAQWPRLTWRYFKAVQQSFYAEGWDVTQPEVLADLAEQFEIPRDKFAEAFASDAMRLTTRRDFEQVQAWGVRGFPTLLAEHEDHLHLVSNGFVPIDTLRERLGSAQAAHD